MNTTFGERLKQYRRAKGLTQQELADRLGVSNKTVSRWESEGGFPDVSLLVPLARALGVTVDDLLDEERPVRSLERADWQGLLSFAFALGGGVLFFLLDLFMPMLLCYLAYLGCVAYGVYLQRYYARHSRWFFLSNGVMALAVNLALVVRTATAAAAVWMAVSIQVAMALGPQSLLLGDRRGWLLLAVLGVLATAGGLTAGMQALILRWNAGKSLRLGRPAWKRPSIRRLLPTALPLLACAFWGTAEGWGQSEAAALAQERWFGLWLCALALLFSLPLLKRGYRRWLLPVWALAALCWPMTGLRAYRWAWSFLSDRRIPYEEGLGDVYTLIGGSSWGMVLLALVLAVLWVLLQALRLRWAEAEDQTRASSSPGSKPA